jgi:thymidine kinase
MAKLYFRYGAMNCGKTTALLQTAHNYSESGQRAIIMKPAVDTKMKSCVTSRLGISREVDLLVGEDNDLYEYFKKKGSELDCILVDEVQFLTVAQIEQLYRIAVVLNIPVICYGLRADFRMDGFPASSRLLELAHSITEMKNVCSCGKKATCNLRLVNGIPVFKGNQVEIDDSDFISYKAVCSECYERLKSSTNA